MCGIAGNFLDMQAAERRVVLQQMCDCIAHRGPDDQGYYADDVGGIAMRRLSIIDIEGGKQPVVSEDGRYQLVFNGEIYNYQKLRDKLRRQGHEFKTNSDTEVVLHQYMQDGANCVEHFNGMFALAIWDRQARTLFLARDRMGIKPLYYYWDGQQFLFASEIKALFASGLIEGEVEPEAIWHYLTYRFIPQSTTIWKNIHKLPPGHSLTISQEKTSPEIAAYWESSYQEPTQAKAPEEYIEEFESLFLDAVRLRLIADVPVGVLLSGGLDSSAVAAAIKEVHNVQLDSFSVAFEGSPKTNELPYAREMAEYGGMNYHEIIIGQKEFMDFLPDLVRFTDEPLADLASVPLYYVSKLAAEKVKVVLSGEGSDEILGGYNFDNIMRLWDQVGQLQRVPQGLRSLGSAMLAPILPERWQSKMDWVREAPQDWLAHAPVTMTSYLDTSSKQSYFKQANDYGDSLAIARQDVRNSGAQQPLHQALYTFCQDWLVEDLLMKADKMTMANSIELRVPFLDHRLVEWAARTPAWVKVGKVNGQGYETKWVLRRFAEKRLPQRIIDRPKQGFPVPVYGWLSDEIKPWVNEMLNDPQALVYRWLNEKPVQQQVGRGTHVGAKMHDRHRLWNLLILELWLREWTPA